VLTPPSLHSADAQQRGDGDSIARIAAIAPLGDPAPKRKKRRRGSRGGKKKHPDAKRARSEMHHAQLAAAAAAAGTDSVAVRCSADERDDAGCVYTRQPLWLNPALARQLPRTHGMKLTTARGSPRSEAPPAKRTRGAGAAEGATEAGAPQKLLTPQPNYTPA
jgi:hypothetical protein